MKPVEFPGFNCTYAKDQPEHLPFHVSITMIQKVQLSYVGS